MNETKIRKPILISGPWITEREIQYVTDAVTNAWYENHAMYHKRFQELFAEVHSAKHALTLPSCTSALHLSLSALGIGPGDEVIVPDATWIATAAPITYVGATPIFGDIDPLTWCLDADSFEASITPRTKAAIVVDLYGSMPDWNRIQKIADAHNITLIEDAAEALGSMHNGHLAGTYGTTGTFSFHGSKTLTTGEGGMLITNNSELFDRVCLLSDHGRKVGDRFFQNIEVAYKYKMSAMQAAIGLAQTERMAEIVTKKREIFLWYFQRLSGQPGFTLNHQEEGDKNSYWMVTVIFDASFGIKKFDLMKDLLDSGIDSRPFFAPLSSLPAYAKHPSAIGAKTRNSTAYRISATGINLPSSPMLTEREVDYVCQKLIEILHRGPN